VSLPGWAVVSPTRRAHIERVVALLGRWADASRLAPAERARWLRAAWLHDALRDVPAIDELAHGPLAADRAAAEGESDRGVLAAVRFHSIGHAAWDDAGKALYLADYLEPGRSFDAAARAALAARVPTEREAVLREVAARRIAWVIESGWPLVPETVGFWNALVSR
jgi:HD superfamily phosphohydrolase YqeK